MARGGVLTDSKGFETSQDYTRMSVSCYKGTNNWEKDELLTSTITTTFRKNKSLQDYPPPSSPDKTNLLDITILLPGSEGRFKYLFRLRKG